MTHDHAVKRPRLAALVLAAALAACHQHDDGIAAAPSESPDPVATDAFLHYVSQLVAAQSDTADPVPTDAVAATTPDDTEPQPLPGI
jgi:nitrous oxide reductase accessory protein NosL